MTTKNWTRLTLLTATVGWICIMIYALANMSCTETPISIPLQEEKKDCKILHTHITSNVRIDLSKGCFGKDIPNYHMSAVFPYEKHAEAFNEINKYIHFAFGLNSNVVRILKQT